MNTIQKIIIEQLKNRLGARYMFAGGFSIYHVHERANLHGVVNFCYYFESDWLVITCRQKRGLIPEFKINISNPSIISKSAKYITLNSKKWRFLSTICTNM